MLLCENLKKTYQAKTVVNGLSFDVKEGEVFALLGSNGAGKSTTIKMILGLVKKEEGEISIKENIHIGYSPETPYFPPFLTGKEVLFYYGRIQGIQKNILLGQVDELMEVVGLEDTKTRVREYSKGMLQRLALAQALIGNPDFLILDEPTAGLDAMGRIEMMQLIQRLKRQGKTILINSHILSDMERVCDRGIIMKKGTLLGTWDKNTDYKGKSLEDIFVELVGGVEEP